MDTVTIQSWVDRFDQQQSRKRYGYGDTFVRCGCAYECEVSVNECVNGVSLWIRVWGQLSHALVCPRGCQGSTYWVSMDCLRVGGSLSGHLMVISALLKITLK
jgi:hypothetical protein